jgi:hypothetical protein
MRFGTAAARALNAAALPLALGWTSLAPAPASTATTGPGSVVQAQLAGRSLTAYPHFQYVRSFNKGTNIEVAIDPNRYPGVVGRTADLYIVASRSEAGWGVDQNLADVRPDGPQVVSFGGASITENTFVVANVLSSEAGAGLGVGYDVVLDLDRDGLLGPGDFIDGRGDEAGFYAVHDTTQPGPLQVIELDHSGGTWLTQRTYYPAGISSMGKLPLVVISHGWTHLYTFYDHIGHHLASYGYVVTAHTNDVGSGDGSATHSASITTLDNTDYIIGEQATIGGGVLNGHIDSHRIVWMGHSTGGEGIVRAYIRLRRDEYTPQHFDIDDVALLAPIAPVAFLSRDNVHPHDVNFHMFVGAADTDTSGAPISGYYQSMAIYERAYGNRQLTYVQGAGHADFHDGGGSSWATGPDLIGRPATHQVVRGYHLPLVELYTKANIAAKDYFTRMYEDFHPPGIPPNVIVATEYRDADDSGAFVVDDFETEHDPGLSSSGGTVTFDAGNVAEPQMREIDGSFDWTGAQPGNGMTRTGSSDATWSLVLDWTLPATRFYESEIVAPARDLTNRGFLSFRACQGTRHPETDALDAPLSFTVTLRDGAGTSRSIDFGNYGRLTRTYLRTGYGTGAGWGNEFNTVRIRLADFATDGGVDLGDVEAVRFDFGAGFGSERGRVGIDDVALTTAPPPVPFELILEHAAGTTTITWAHSETALTYNVYRGTVPQSGFGTRGSGTDAYDHTCFESEDAAGDGPRVAVDGDPIPPGSAGYYYIVSAVGPVEEGSMGQSSFDLDPGAPGVRIERPRAAPCP